MASPSKLQNFAVEILSDIFLECLDDINLPRFRQNAAPLNVSHVCRHWRSASLSISRLWAKIWLKCTTDSATTERALPALRLFLSRSGCVDFHVEIDCMMDVPEGLDPVTNDHRRECCVDKSLVEGISHELTTHRERIKGVTLAMPWIFFHAAVQYVTAELPSLEHLTARIYHNPSRPQRQLVTPSGTYTIMADLGPQPRLGKGFWESVSGLVSLGVSSHQHLSFDMHDHHAGDSFPVVFTELRHLTMNSIIHLSVLRQILQNSPVLETLCFSPGLRLAHPEELQMTSSFPSVLSLECTVGKLGGPNRKRQILEVLRFPNLQRFVLRDFTGIESVFETFLDESNPPLDELCLIEDSLIPVDEASTVRVLKSRPDLKKLRIPLHPGVLRALVLSGSASGSICPSLQEITLDILGMAEGVATEAWNATKDMIHSRWTARTRPEAAMKSPSDSLTTASTWSPRCLRRLNLPAIEKDDWMMHPLYEAIKNCQLEGLIVGFQDPNPLPIRMRW